MLFYWKLYLLGKSNRKEKKLSWLHTYYYYFIIQNLVPNISRPHLATIEHSGPLDNEISLANARYTLIERHHLHCLGPHYGIDANGTRVAELTPIAKKYCRTTIGKLFNWDPGREVHGGKGRLSFDPFIVTSMLYSSGGSRRISQWSCRLYLLAQCAASLKQRVAFTQS